MIAVGGGNIAGLLLGVITGVIAARVLGVKIRGEVVAAQTWAGTAAALLTLGVTQAVVVYTGGDNRLAKPIFLQSVITVLTGLGMFSVLAVSNSLPWLNYAGVIGGALLTGGLLVAANSSGLAQRRKRMKGEFQLVRLIPQVASVAAMVWLWLANIRDPNTWILALGIAALAPSSILLFPLIGGVHSLAGRQHWAPPRRLVVGAANAFTSVVGATVIYSLDGLLVAALMPSEKVALYSVAVSAAAACTAVGRAVGMVTFSELRGIVDVQARRVLIQHSLVRSLLITSAVAFPLILVAPQAISLIYGNAFLAAALPTRWLVLASIPLAGDYLLIHALLSMGAGRSVLQVQIVAGALTVPFLLAAIATGQLALVALVSVGIYPGSAALLFWSVRRQTGAPELNWAVQ